jgi:hypothetical protein
MFLVVPEIGKRVDCKDTVVVETTCDFLDKLCQLLLVKMFYQIACNRELESARDVKVGDITANELYTALYVFGLIAKTVLRELDRCRRIINRRYFASAYGELVSHLATSAT